MPEAVIYRPVQYTDIPYLTDLYNYYILHTAATFDLKPVTRENREHWLAEHSPGSRYIAIAACAGERLIGYASSSRFRDKAAYDTSVETSIYLHPDYTGREIGTELYSRLFAGLSAADVHRAYACITVPNPPSLALHLRFGFRQVGLFTEAGFKFGRYRDIQWMEKALPALPPHTRKAPGAERSAGSAVQKSQQAGYSHET